MALDGCSIVLGAPVVDTGGVNSTKGIPMDLGDPVDVLQTPTVLQEIAFMNWQIANLQAEDARRRVELAQIVPPLDPPSNSQVGEP